MMAVNTIGGSKTILIHRLHNLMTATRLPEDLMIVRRLLDDKLPILKPHFSQKPTFENGLKYYLKIATHFWPYRARVQFATEGQSKEVVHNRLIIFLKQPSHLLKQLKHQHHHVIDTSKIQKKPGENAKALKQVRKILQYDPTFVAYCSIQSVRQKLGHTKILLRNSVQPYVFYLLDGFCSNPSTGQNRLCTYNQETWENSHFLNISLDHPTTYLSKYFICSRAARLIEKKVLI